VRGRGLFMVFRHVTMVDCCVLCATMTAARAGKTIAPALMVLGANTSNDGWQHHIVHSWG
jgi:hypothetical protein